MKSTLEGPKMTTPKMKLLERKAITVKTNTAEIDLSKCQRNCSKWSKKDMLPSSSSSSSLYWSSATVFYFSTKEIEPSIRSLLSLFGQGLLPDHAGLKHGQ